MGKITANEITSKNNQLFKDTKKLFTSSRARKQADAFVLEGARLTFDVLNSVYGVRLFLTTKKAYDKFADKADKMIQKAEHSYFISEELAQRLGETENSQGIFAVCEMKKQSDDICGRRIIALDNLQDPANLGAIIRTAEALGIDGIITHNCCDIYNPKALRASMGSLLRMKISDTCDLKAMLDDMRGEYKIYATVPSDSATKITDIDFSGNVICIIGNEANGVDEQIIKMSDKAITIPMLGKAESLNAGVAAAITMWEMLR